MPQVSTLIREIKNKIKSLYYLPVGHPKSLDPLPKPLTTSPSRNRGRSVEDMILYFFADWTKLSKRMNTNATRCELNET